MKKIMSVMIVVLCFTMLVGCGAGKLSDNFNEETLKSEAEAIIDNFNNNQYEEIINKGDENLKSQLTADQLKEVWEQVAPKLGDYDGISKIAFKEKDGTVAVVALAKYENSKAQFTMSFNEDMQLIGIFLK